MNKLENIVKKFARNTLLAGSLLFGGAFAQEAYSQNVVSGTVKETVTNSTEKTRITFKNLANGEKYSQLTADGTFSINLPTGTYERKIEAGTASNSNYLILDTLTINSNTTLNDQLIRHFMLTTPTLSTKTGLWGIKEATTTQDSDGIFNGTIRYNVKEHSLRTGPIRLFVNRANIPSGYEDDVNAGLADLAAKFGPIFNEQPTDNTNEGVSFRFHTTATWPSELPPTTAYTVQDAWYDSHHNKHWTVHFNTDNFIATSTTAQRATEKELGVRVLSLNTFGPDFVYLMSSAATTDIHADEVKMFEVINALKDGTRMKKYREITITSVPNTFFSTVSVNTPTYNTSNQLVVSHNRTNQRDPDGDIGNVEQVWNFYTMSNVLHHTVTVTNGDTVKVPENTFVENVQYKARVTLKEKLGASTLNTIVSSDLIFTARNKAPVVAANFTDGSTAAWDTNNQYKIIATVTDNDPTTTKIELYEGTVSPTTKIKEITGTQLTVNKNEVKGVEHVVKIYSNDGTTTTTILPHLYFPDNPTSLSLDAAENETFAWNANNQRIVNLTATDQDGPVSAKKVGVYETNNTLIKEINGEQLAVDKGPRGQKKIKAQGTQNGITTTLEILVNYPNNNPTGNADLVNESTLAWNASNKYRVNFTSSDYDSDAVSIASKAKNGASTLQQATGSFIDLDKANFQANTRYDLEVTFSDGYGGSYIHTIQFNTPNTPMNMSLDVATNETFVWDANNKRKIIMTATDADGPVSGKKVGVYNLANSVIQEIEGSELDVNKLPRGQYKAKGQGTQGPENKVVEVPFNAPNNNPTIADLVATYSGNTLNTSTTASDFDSDALSYKYTLTGNGANYTGTGSSWSLPLDQLQGGKEYDLTVEVSDQYNGKSTKTIKTTTPPITGVEDPKLIGDEVEISTFPNPVMDYINMKVKSSTPIKYHVEIYDNLGRLVDHDSQNHYGQEYEEKYDFSRFAPGQYFMKVTVEDSHGKSNTATRKLIKN